MRSRGGFFENDADYCTGLTDGAFHKVRCGVMMTDDQPNQCMVSSPPLTRKCGFLPLSKVLAIRLLRDVDGQQFADALNKYLVPRMTLAGGRRMALA